MATIKTRVTLVQRLGDEHDHQAWELFYDTYHQLIFNFALSKGCSQQMAAEVLQETCIRLYFAMRTFEYNPKRGKFRSFVLQIGKNYILDNHRRNQKFAELDETTASKAEASLAAESTPEAWFDEWDRAWHQNVLRLALERVRAKIKPQTYESFRMYVLEGQPVATVIEKLGIERNTIYQHRARVLGLVNKEVRNLQEELGD